MYVQASRLKTCATFLERFVNSPITKGRGIVDINQALMVLMREKEARLRAALSRDDWIIPDPLLDAITVILNAHWQEKDAKNP